MGYRILNASLNPRVPCQPLRADESPELIYMEVRDKKFAYDPNSMALLEVGSEEDYLNLRNNPPSPYIMARYKPVFQAGGAPEPRVSTLVLGSTLYCNLACQYPLEKGTWVPTVDGKNVRVEDFVNKEYTVYSYHDGMIIPTKATGVLSSPRAEVLEMVAVDRYGKKKIIRAEPSHQFMLADGRFRCLKDIKTGDVLMPFYRKKPKNAKEMVMHPGSGVYQFTSTILNGINSNEKKENRNTSEHNLLDLDDMSFDEFLTAIGYFRLMKSEGLIPKDTKFYDYLTKYHNYVPAFLTATSFGFCGPDRPTLERFARHYPRQEPLCLDAPNHVVESVKAIGKITEIYCLVVDHPCHNVAIIGSEVDGETELEDRCESGIISAQCFVHLYPELCGNDNTKMTFEMAKRAIDDLVDTRGHISVGFFGGEPMTNWPLIEKVTEYVFWLAKQKSPKCQTCDGRGKIRGGETCPACLGFGVMKPSMHITTNGTLFTPERVDFINRHGYSLIVSIDGTAKSHDVFRAYRDGRPSWHKVMEGLKLLKGTRVAESNTLRSTFTANSNESIAERLEFLNQLCDEENPCASWVSVEPAALSHKDPRKNPVLEIHVNNAWERFEQEYMEGADWYIKRALSGKMARWHNVSKTIERFLWAIHAASECGAGRGYLTCGGDGKIYACHRQGLSFLGTLSDGLDEQLRSDWLENRIYARKGCLTCPVRYSCGGGCREDSFADSGDIHIPSGVQCQLKQLWDHTALYIMASVPKTRLVEMVKDPGNSPRSWDLCSFVPASRVKYDASGMSIPEFINGIPVTALVKPETTCS